MIIYPTSDDGLVPGRLYTLKENGLSSLTSHRVGFLPYGFDDKHPGYILPTGRAVDIAVNKEVVLFLGEFYFYALGSSQEPKSLFLSSEGKIFGHTMRGVPLFLTHCWKRVV